jgi:hypothetical protein
MRTPSSKTIKSLAVFTCLSLLLTGCGSSSQSSSSPEEVDLSKFVVTYGDTYSSKLREGLTSKYENQITLMSVVPFFIDAPNIEVISDPDYKNLEVSARALLSETAELKYGKSFRYPRKSSTYINGDLDLENGDYICAKDVMQKFTRDILWILQYNGYPVPEESLKVTVDFYTITGTVKEDEYGNEDYSGQKEKTLVKALIHMSNSTLKKISDAYGPDDFYVLSDLTKPVRHPSSWNQCRSWTS